MHHCNNSVLLLIQPSLAMTRQRPMRRLVTSLLAVAACLAIASPIAAVAYAPYVEPLIGSSQFYGQSFTLSGGQGSCFDSTFNRVLVVEGTAGYLSSVSIFGAPKFQYPFSNKQLAPSNNLNGYSFSAGNGAQGGDISYDTLSAGVLSLRALGNNQAQLLGTMSAAQFASLSAASLQNMQAPALSGASGSIPATSLAVGSVVIVWNAYPAGSNPCCGYNPTFDYAAIRITAIAPGPGTITFNSTAFRLYSRYSVLGTGYSSPTDVSVSADGVTAWVLESGFGGNLLQVSTSSAGRGAAAVLTTGLSSPQQLYIDKTVNSAFVLEGAGAGRLMQVNLANSQLTTLLSGLSGATGLLMSADRSYAFISFASSGQIIKYSTASKHGTLVATVAAASRLAWADAGQSAFYVVSPSSHTLYIVSLSTSPATVTAVGGTQTSPASVAVISPNEIAVTSAQLVDLWTLNNNGLSAAGPYLLGIGFVPKTSIDANGYASTDPGYFFQVSKSPFGGTLPLMVNHDKARAAGAYWYYLQVDGVTVLNPIPWGDYLWSTASSKFVYTPAAQSGHSFAVRQAGDVWYNYWLGSFLDTTGLSNGQHTLSVVFTDAWNLPVTSDSVLLAIDNGWPTASIDAIIYYPNAGNPGGAVTVPTCGIVQGANDQFSFSITATDPERNLLSYSLSVVWGNNQGVGILSDSYTNHNSQLLWPGFSGLAASPPNQWHAKQGSPCDPYSLACAHTFYLSVWDRTINGYGYIHQAGYTRSITLLLTTQCA